MLLLKLLSSMAWSASHVANEFPALNGSLLNIRLTYCRFVTGILTNPWTGRAGLEAHIGDIASTSSIHQ